jgi:uncharacterized protein (TIGR01777 family)
MRIMIAGGSGLIGRELISLFTYMGDEVLILSRSPEKVIGLPAGALAIQWDGKTLQDWGSKVEDCDVVINLTGENLSGNGFLPTRWTKERKFKLIQSRVDSGLVLNKAIELAGKKPSVFVQASGINYYKKYQGKAITEIDDAGNDFLANLSKEWEASSEAVESMGIRRVIIRNGVVLSMKGGALRFLLLPYKFFVGGQLGNGKQIYSWIHITDEIEAIMYLIKNDQASGPYNLTSPVPVKNNEFGRTIAKVMKRPHYLTIPTFIMRLTFGEVATMVLEGQKILPKRLMDSGYQFKYPLLEDALVNLLFKN